MSDINPKTKQVGGSPSVENGWMDVTPGSWEVGRGEKLCEVCCVVVVVVVVVVVDDYDDDDDDDDDDDSMKETREGMSCDRKFIHQNNLYILFSW